MTAWNFSWLSNHPYLLYKQIAKDSDSDPLFLRGLLFLRGEFDRSQIGRTAAGVLYGKRLVVNAD